MKRIDRVKERAPLGLERLGDELLDAKSQAKSDQAQLIQNTDQCLAENLVLATKESEERDSRMTQKIERLFNDHDNTYAQTMKNLERKIDAKADLVMRKLDELLSSSSQENRYGPSKKSRQATEGFRAPRYAEAPRDREQVLSSVESRFDGSNHARGGSPIRGTFAHSAACQIGSRFDHHFA